MVEKTWLISWITKFLGGMAGALFALSVAGEFLLIPFVVSIVMFIITGVIVFFQKDIEERFAKEIAAIEIVCGDTIKDLAPELRDIMLERLKEVKAEEVLKLHRGD